MDPEYEQSDQNLHYLKHYCNKKTCLILDVPTNRIKIALLSYGTDLSGLFILAKSHIACILARNLKKMRPGLPAGHYLADRD